MRAIYEPMIEKLVEIARAARDLAVNYRGFKVGVAVIAQRPTQRTGFAIFAGSNKMLHKGDPHKECGEKHAIDEAIRCGYTRILAIVVVGKPQPDDESGFFNGTLHPCGACRRMFIALAHADHVYGDTIVLTVDSRDTANREEWTVSSLVSTHFLCGKEN